MARPQLARNLLLLLVAAASSCARAGADVPAGLARAPPSPLPTGRPAELRLEDIKLPPGFKIQLFINESDYIPARMLALGQADERATVVYVSTAQQGAVFAVVDRRDGSPRSTCLLLDGGNVPNGIAYDARTGTLYVAEVDAMLRVDGADAAALAGCDATLLDVATIANGTAGGLPPQEKHANRGLTLGPDGLLYYTVGAPFDSGEECYGPYCAVWRMDTEGGGLEQVAADVRNAAALAWHPRTGQLLAVGMERTGMGDELPDDVLITMPVDGGVTNWSWPYCHWQGGGPAALRTPGYGSPVPDPDVPLPSTAPDASEEEQAEACGALARRPIQALGPHVSPLGIAYWEAAASSKAPGARPWPAQYEGTVFVGQHGSFNSTPPTGYRIANVGLSPDGRTATAHTVFAEGWVGEDGVFWGRPTGLLRLPDGSMLVADDYANTVYQISYDGAPPAQPAPATSAGAHGAAARTAAAAAAALAVAALAVL